MASKKKIKGIWVIQVQDDNSIQLTPELLNYLKWKAGDLIIVEECKGGYMFKKKI